MSDVANVTALIEWISGTRKHPIDRHTQRPLLTVCSGGYMKARLVVSCAALSERGAVSSSS